MHGCVCKFCDGCISDISGTTVVLLRVCHRSWANSYRDQWELSAGITHIHTSLYGPHSWVGLHLISYTQLNLEKNTYWFMFLASYHVHWTTFGCIQLWFFLRWSWLYLVGNVEFVAFCISHKMHSLDYYFSVLCCWFDDRKGIQPVPQNLSPAITRDSSLETHVGFLV